MPMAEKRKCCVCSRRSKFQTDLRKAFPKRDLIKRYKGITVTENYLICNACYHSVMSKSKHELTVSKPSNSQANISFPEPSTSSSLSQPQPDDDLDVSPTLHGGPTRSSACVQSHINFDDPEALALFTRSLTYDQKCEVLTALAPDITNDLQEFSARNGNPRSLQSLGEISPRAFLSHCPDLLLALLNTAKPNENEIAKAKVLELLCKIVNKNFLGPLTFREMGVAQFVCFSKVTRALISHSLPCGAYETFRRFIETQSLSASNKYVVPACDIITAFDNQQIIGKQYSIEAYAQQPISTCTAVLHYEVEDSNLQFRGLIGLAESNILSFQERKDESLLLITRGEADMASLFTKASYAKALARIKPELTSDNVFKMTQFTAEVSSLLKSMAVKQCYVCDNTYPTTTSNCTTCKLPLPTRTSTRTSALERIAALRQSLPKCLKHDRTPPNFSHVPQGAWEIHKISNDLPLYCLPSSKEGVKRIVRDLGKRLGIELYGGRRKFAVLGCDGQPYFLLLSIIENTLLCLECRNSFDSLKEFDKHDQEMHGSTALSTHEFEWVILQMGTGHFEMNYQKAVLDILWDDYFVHIAHVMNFTSEKALAYIKNGSDTHKSYQLFCIFKDAVLDELVLHFAEKTVGPDFKFEDFCVYMETSANPSARNAYYALIHFIEPLFIFRAGVRKNNPDYIKLGVKLGARAFFARTSPKYQQICLHYLSQRKHLPLALIQFLDKFQSIVRRTEAEKAQGIDFILEEENRLAKKFLSANAQKKDWDRVYTLLDHLKELREKAFSGLGCSDPKTSRQSNTSISAEVEKLRVTIKNKEVFEQPEHVGVNLGGGKLKLDLAHEDNASAPTNNSGPSSENAVSSDEELGVDSDIGEEEL